jgi:PAS domain S-box-containing protein
MKQNNEIYKYLFESAVEGLVVTNQRGEIVLVNPRLEQLFGYKKEELIGKTIEILLPQKFRHSHVAQRDKYIEKPKNRSMGTGIDLCGCKKDGSEFSVEISLNYFKTEGETFVMGLITDISERKKMEDELKHLNQHLEDTVRERTDQLRISERLHSAIAQNFPDGIISVFDRDLRYILAEGKELRKLGISGKKLLGTRYIDRLPQEIQSNVENLLLSVLEGAKGSIEFELRNNFYIIDAVPLLEGNGSVENILVVERNITKQKLTEQEMLNALDKEKQLNELKSRFVSMASHEFRTPLSTVLSSVSLIDRYKEEKDQDKRHKHVNRIKSSVHHLTSILNDFLSLDKLEEGKAECKPELFNLKELLKAISEDMQEVSKEGQTISFAYEGESEAFLDKNMIRNISNNLLSNAIKYSNENSSILFKINCIETSVKIEVKDSGIGIAEDDQKHMFERLFRAKNSTNIEGTGLGLNIVKKYVDLMNGEIEFISTLGKGTTFFVTLPNQKP